ncbi:MAG: C-terminal binding protein [Chloroflexi bacterium]|nr:C-terminal binding protein [Chloroflexota bacterium]
MTTVVVAHESYVISDLEQDAFRAIDASVLQTGNLETPTALEAARKADALMVTIQTVDAALIGSLSNCKIIARVGTGLDAIDIPAAAAQGIWVTSVPDYSIDEVSTHAIALLLNHARRLQKMFASVRAGAWYDAAAIEPAPRLSGQVLGLIGYGRIGSTVAAKARGLGLDVIVVDPFIEIDEAQDGVRQVDLDALLATADFISLHSPLSDSSRHIINAAALEKMKSSAYLINTARGELIDEEALLNAVQSGSIAGAALDVLTVEPPPPDFPLLRDERITITPHAGWYSEASKLDVRVKAIDDVLRVLSGKAPRSPVNRPRGKK